MFASVTPKGFHSTLADEDIRRLNKAGMKTSRPTLAFVKRCANFETPPNVAECGIQYTKSLFHENILRFDAKCLLLIVLRNVTFASIIVHLGKSDE